MSQYEKIWEGTDLFGFDVIDFLVYFGKKHSYWRLFINRKEVNKAEIDQIPVVKR